MRATSSSTRRGRAIGIRIVPDMTGARRRSSPPRGSPEEGRALGRGGLHRGRVGRRSVGDVDGARRVQALPSRRSSRVTDARRSPSGAARRSPSSPPSPSSSAASPRSSSASRIRTPTPTARTSRSTWAISRRRPAARSVCTSTSPRISARAERSGELREEALRGGEIVAGEVAQETAHDARAGEAVGEAAREPEHRRDEGSADQDVEHDPRRRQQAEEVRVEGAFDDDGEERDPQQRATSRVAMVSRMRSTRSVSRPRCASTSGAPRSIRRRPTSCRAAAMTWTSVTRSSRSAQSRKRGSCRCAARKEPSHTIASPFATRSRTNQIRSRPSAERLRRGPRVRSAVTSTRTASSARSFAARSSARISSIVFIGLFSSRGVAFVEAFLQLVFQAVDAGRDGGDGEADDRRRLLVGVAVDVEETSARSTGSSSWMSVRRRRASSLTVSLTKSATPSSKPRSSRGDRLAGASPFAAVERHGDVQRYPVHPGGEAELRVVARERAPQLQDDLPGSGRAGRPATDRSRWRPGRGSRGAAR